MSDARYKAILENLRSYETERSWLEFKSNESRPDKIGTLISAISNAARASDRDCGYIAWGIHDVSHDVIGTTFNPHTLKIGNEPLEFWLSKKITPDLHFQFVEVVTPVGKVILLEVPAAIRIPTKFEKIAYIRIGEATSPLADYPEREVVLLAKLRPFDWEGGVAASFLTSEEVLSALDVDGYFRLTNQKITRNSQDVFRYLERDSLVQPDAGKRWKILNLGAILFAKSLGDFPSIARKRLRIVQYLGDDRTGLEFTQHTIETGYAVGFEGLITFVNDQLPKNQEIGKVFRVERPVYPEIAVRELVANALLHQDFAVTGAGPIIEIFNKRLEITNPGSPLEDIARLTDLPPRSRNEALGGLMRRMRICEELGSGLRRVIANLEMFQLPPLQLRAESNSTTARLFSPKTYGEMEPSERLLACYQHSVIRYYSDKRMTNATLRERMGIKSQNASQVSKILKHAVRAGLIKPSEGWNARSGHYLPFWAPAP